MDDEFYIGWEDRAPSRTARSARRVVLCLLALAAGLAALIAVVQRTVGASAFEWGVIKGFSGVFRSQPYPHLLVRRPGAVGSPGVYSSYYLVKPFKFGLDTETAGRLDGQPVSLKGTLIYREGQTMIEVVEDSIRPLVMSATGTPTVTPDLPVGLGEQTLAGEIVDSKCYLGVMNPGRFIPHRGCAIRCISGGIPPMLVVSQVDGPALCFLLVSKDGRPVNQQVLDLVAEPVTITGEVERQGDLLILRADPATYRRVAR